MLIAEAVPAALRWSKEQTEYLTPVQITEGEIRAALEQLLKTGLIVPGRAAGRPGG
jgi:hypothetical protein